MKLSSMVVMLALLVSYSNMQAQTSEDLTDWILGTNEPEISTGTRGDGTSGDYIHVPVGTSPFHYEVMDEGEGNIRF